MITIEIKLRGQQIASFPIDESILRDLAYAPGACSRSIGRNANTSTEDGYTVRLHRDPGADSLQVVVRERGDVRAEVHVSIDGVRDLLDADHTTYFVSCGYDEMAKDGPGHGYAVAFTRPKPWLTA